MGGVESEILGVFFGGGKKEEKEEEELLRSTWASVQGLSWFLSTGNFMVLEYGSGTFSRWAPTYETGFISLGLMNKMRVYMHVCIYIYVYRLNPEP